MAKRDRLIVAIVTMFAVIMLCGCRSLGGRQLCAAIRAGHLNKTEALLKFNPRMINTVFRNGKAPLLVAANSGQLEIAELLIAKGAEVNIKGSDGKTALHYAAFVGNVEIAKLLITNGANVKIRAENGATALHYATCVGHEEITALLIANGVDVNIKGPLDLTALHVIMDKASLIFPTNDMSERALEERVVSALIIEALLKAGAHVSARDKFDRTPLHIAAKFNIIIGAEMLIKAGAKLTDRDSDGKTPLDCAETAGMIKLLKAHGDEEQTLPKTDQPEMLI